MLRLLLLILLACPACASGYQYLGAAQSDDHRRVWVVHDGELYRCVDGADVNALPKPVCVRAATTN